MYIDVAGSRRWAVHLMADTVKHLPPTVRLMDRVLHAAYVDVYYMARLKPDTPYIDCD